MNLYTTLPWPALCAEVSKLKISLREGGVLDGDLRALATKLATTQRTARKRWVKEATPAGFETEEQPNRFADVHSSGERLGVPLGSGGIAWRHLKSLRSGPQWAPEA